jgi:hypothetical protein
MILFGTFVLLSSEMKVASTEMLCVCVCVCVCVSVATRMGWFHKNEPQNVTVYITIFKTVFSWVMVLFRYKKHVFIFQSENIKLLSNWHRVDWFLCMSISEEHATLSWSKSRDSGHRMHLRHLETLKTSGSVSLSHMYAHTHTHTHTYIECNEQWRRTLYNSPYSKTSKSVHIDMWPETFNLWVITERILSWPISRAMRNVLSNTYHDRWIGREGPTAWPPRSPDLNPHDFYLWKCLKTLCLCSSCWQPEAVHRHIVDACQTISNYPRVFERMRWSIMRRVWGGRALNLMADILNTCYYEYIFSVITHGSNVSEHMLAWIFFLVLSGTRVQSLSPLFSYTLYIYDSSLASSTGNWPPFYFRVGRKPSVIQSTIFSPWRFLQNVGDELPDYTVSHLRRNYYSRRWKFVIL